ncbi:MAG: acyltransferase [Lachnospiraceae bacterium]|nr:acyltransferase [Lachnospiraceae bacterium]
MSAASVRYYNMDVVRYVLSTLVYSNHFFYLTGSDLPGTIRGGVQPAFFALSGFLIYRSFEKSRSVKGFLVKRMIRLMPLYWFVVFAFALALSGVSSLGVLDYFTDVQFWKYILANTFTLNFMEPTLPGVFEGGEMVSASVNGALWTMKVEILLTVTYPLMDKLMRRFPAHRNMILAGVIFLSVLYTQCMLSMLDITGNKMYEILVRQFLGQFYVFYLGVLIYLNLPFFYRHKWEIFFTVVVLFIANATLLGDKHVLRFALLAVGVVWLSIVGDWGAKLAHSDNLSYGIYLCHYPMINLAVYFGLPSVLPVPVLFVIVFAAVVAVARLLVPPANRFSGYLTAKCRA